MKVWIDFSNSPHPLLFGPIVRRLENLGHEVVLTARDNAQTVELAGHRWSSLSVIGDDSPRNVKRKAGAIISRALALSDWARRTRPDVAFSHQSYSQIMAGRLLKMPVLTAMDFEYQPANHLSFRLAHRILLPQALRSWRTRRQGAVNRKTVYYPGLKEEVYLADFDYDRHILERLRLKSPSGAFVVVARTPPTRALYHRFENPLFLDALQTIGREANVSCVVLIRHPEQRRAITDLRLPYCAIPESAIDARSLMLAANLVIGAGGTMTREAALLGVRTYSVFAGHQPAVDRWLEEQALLRTLRSSSDLEALRQEPHFESNGTSTRRDTLARLRARSERLVDVFVEAATTMTRP